MDLGKILRYYRNVEHFSQDELADKAKINEKYYGKIERNENCPTMGILRKICNALGIDLIELFLFEIVYRKNNSGLGPKACKLINYSLKSDIDVHFNREIIFKDCESSIWYNGFIGSINFDEFEMKIYAVGNIKAQLYINYEKVLELNSEDVSNKLMIYIKNDKNLEKVIEYMPYDQGILAQKNGNALFISESNWLTATIIDNNDNSILYEDIILDSDNIFECLGNKELLFDYIFRKP